MQGVNILYLMLGWLLGIFSPLIADEVKRHCQKKEFKKGLSIELEGVGYLLSGAVYLLCSRFGTYDRDLLNWIFKIYAQYNDRKMLRRIETLLKASDEEIDAYAKHMAQQKDVVALNLKKYSLPFLESNMGSVSLLDIKLQRLVIQIRARLNSVNEEIDLNRFYYEKTFDSTLSEDNSEIIENNLNQSYQNISRQYRMIVDQITYLTDKLS
jgi:hypothetical protein